jgi:hypothetical protein
VVFVSEGVNGSSDSRVGGSWWARTEVARDRLPPLVGEFEGGERVALPHAVAPRNSVRFEAELAQLLVDLSADRNKERLTCSSST